MKQILKLTPIYILVLLLCSYGIWQFFEENKVSQMLPTQPSEPPKLNTQIMPENVIAQGDYFEYQPDFATGHFRCRITGARVVADAAECPPTELFMEKSFNFPEGFDDAAAYEQGCRIVLVELEMTNIDAEGYAYDSTTSTSSGWFKDPYVFYPHAVINLADLAITYGEKDELDYEEFSSQYFDQRYGYMPEDDPDTIGVETEAIRIAPGETKTVTLGFSIGGRNGKPIDMTMLRAVLSANSNHMTGLFINLELEGEL